MLGTRRKKRETVERRYRGQLVFEDVDTMGLMEVVDDRDLRSLHFGSREKQSAMSLSSHHQLMLSYTKAMVAGLLFVERPKMILNVGLGGGSLPKFFLHNYPECVVDVVELREKVVDLAYTYFYMPHDPRLNVFICDIKEYFRKARTKTYDVILLDVFNKDGLSDSVKAFSFMNVCKNQLNPGGVLITNLWSQPDKTYKKMVYNIFKCFKSQVMILPVTDRSNHIAIGINQAGCRYKHSQLIKRSRILEQAFQIGLPELCTSLCEHNGRLLTGP